MTANNGRDPNAASHPGSDAGESPSPGSRVSLLGARGTALVSGLGGSRSETPKLGKGGAYEVGSESFRKACAILEDGTVCIVRAYNDGELAAELAELQARYNLPVETRRRAATLDEIAELHGNAVQAVVSSRPTPGQLRLRRVLAEAADLGASDVKLVERQNHGHVRLKAGAGEHTHGSQWQPKEVEEAVSWIYSYRDGGDGKASLVDGLPAGFSIGQSGALPGMPDGIGAFRGQIAWHSDVKRFLNLRLLPKADAASQSDLEGLGLDRDILDALAEERRTESGLVIVAGSTGDGKSTTLVRNLGRLYEERKGQVSICTLEDPIEYVLDAPGIVQFAVDPGKTPEERNANWSALLMVFVRIAPDVGMISEIRSAAGANEILQFVSSGHKVFTTVHAESANGVLFRLVSLGVRPEELGGPKMVSLVMRQKLVPALCRNCAEEVTGPAMARVQEWLGEDPYLEARGGLAGIEPLRRNRAGCDVCMAPYKRLTGAMLQTARAAWAGYSGRRATAEFIRVDDDYRKLLIAQDALGAEEHWLAPTEKGGMGGIPLSTRLRRLVASGVTDFEHVTNEALPAPQRAIAGPKASVAPDGAETGGEAAEGKDHDD